MDCNRILICAIILGLLGFSAPLHASEHVPDEHIAAKFGIEFAQNYLEASQVYNEMWALFPRSTGGEPEYPMYYGGHFFCEKGKFNLNIVDAFTQEAEAGVFAELLKKDYVEVRTVRFSHKALIGVLDEIRRFVVSNPDSELKIAAWGIDSPNNMVVVQVQGYSETVDTAFKRNVIDSPMVRLEEGKPVGALVPRAYEKSAICENVAHLQSGERIFIGQHGFSAGYPAVRGEESGFVTALHGLPLEGQAVRLGSASGAVVGKVTAPICFSGSADGAFISLHQADFNQMVDGRTLISSNNRPSQGMILVSASTPPDGTMRTQRNIVVTNAHFNANMGGGLVLTDMIQTTGYALYGESGGLVFRPVGSDAQTQGVIVGSEIASAKGDNMFFAWAGAIDSAIDVTQESGSAAFH